MTEISSTLAFKVGLFQRACLLQNPSVFAPGLVQSSFFLCLSIYRSFLSGFLCLVKSEAPFWQEGIVHMQMICLPVAPKTRVFLHTQFGHVLPSTVLKSHRWWPTTLTNAISLRPWRATSSKASWKARPSTRHCRPTSPSSSGPSPRPRSLREQPPSTSRAPWLAATSTPPSECWTTWSTVVRKPLRRSRSDKC